MPMGLSEADLFAFPKKENTVVSCLFHAFPAGIDVDSANAKGGC